MITEAHRLILEHVAEVVQGNESIESFEEWLIGYTWDIGDGSEDIAALEVARELQLSLAEFLAGHLDNAHLLRRLRHQLEHIYASTGPIVRSSTSSRIVRHPVSLRTAAVVGTPVEAAPA